MSLKQFQRIALFGSFIGTWYKYFVPYNQFYAKMYIFLKNGKHHAPNSFGFFVVPILVICMKAQLAKLDKLANNNFLVTNRAPYDLNSEKQKKINVTQKPLALLKFALMFYLFAT